MSYLLPFHINLGRKTTWMEELTVSFAHLKILFSWPKVNFRGLQKSINTSSCLVLRIFNMFNLPSCPLPWEKPLQKSAHALPMESLKEEALDTINSQVEILDFTSMRLPALSEMMPFLSKHYCWPQPCERDWMKRDRAKSRQRSLSDSPP